MTTNNAVAINKEVQPMTNKLKKDFTPPIYFVAILTMAYVVLAILGDSVQLRMGVLPRSLWDLPGVLLHPLLHTSVRHLFFNALGILILGGLISMGSHKMLFKVTAFAWLGGGVLLWLLGRPDFVVGGASGIVYGYLGFILLHGIFERSIKKIGLALIVLFFFHDLIFAMAPLQTPAPGQIGVSWEGHLFGFLAGTMCAYLSVFNLQGKRLKPLPPKKETPREKAEKVLFSDEEIVDPREKIVDEELAAIKRKVGK